MTSPISDPKTLFAIQQDSRVPFNVGDGELISFPEGWILKAAGRSWLVMPANEKEVLKAGPIKFAIPPEHVHIASGGGGFITGRIKKGVRDYLRVLTMGKIWWVTGEPFDVSVGVSLQPDMKQAFFFNPDGRRLSLRVICIIKKRRSV